MNTTQIILFAILLILVVVFGPLIVIWSINTLFGTGIAYSIEQWVAALILAGFVSTRLSKD